MNRPSIPLPLAEKIIARLCEKHGIEQVLPSDWRRFIIVRCVWVALHVVGSKVTVEELEASLSVALPGAGSAVDLLKLIPTVGTYLAAFCEAARQPTIAMAPRLFRIDEGNELLAYFAEELEHQKQIRLTGYLGTLGYLLASEQRGGNEAQGKAQSMAGLVWFCGMDPRQAGAEARRSLAGYGIDTAAEALADSLVSQTEESLAAGAPIAGSVMEIRDELIAEGITGLPGWPGV